MLTLQPGFHVSGWKSDIDKHSLVLVWKWKWKWNLGVFIFSAENFILLTSKKKWKLILYTVHCYFSDKSKAIVGREESEDSSNFIQYIIYSFCNTLNKFNRFVVL